LECFGFYPASTRHTRRLLGFGRLLSVSAALAVFRRIWRLLGFGVLPGFYAAASATFYPASTRFLCGFGFGFAFCYAASTRLLLLGGFGVFRSVSEDYRQVRANFRIRGLTVSRVIIYNTANLLVRRVRAPSIVGAYDIGGRSYQLRSSAILWGA
jgi:hypothetical protein